MSNFNCKTENCLGPRKPNHQRRCRSPGKRDPGVHQVSERRSSACGAHALDKSVACRLAKALGVRRLHGAPSASLEVMRANPQLSSIMNSRRLAALLVLSLLIAIAAV